MPHVVVAQGCFRRTRAEPAACADRLSAGLAENNLQRRSRDLWGLNRRDVPDGSRSGSRSRVAMPCVVVRVCHDMRLFFACAKGLKVIRSTVDRTGVNPWRKGCVPAREGVDRSGHELSGAKASGWRRGSEGGGLKTRMQTILPRWQ